MSELTSSTEVDGACSVLSVDTACNSQAENTAGPEPSISEHTDDNPDSITHDFVHVNIPINADADEIRLETNQPSFIAGYLAPYAEYIPSLQSIQYVLPTWLFQATQNEGATSTSLDTNPEAESFETWVNETVTGDYTSSIKDEQRFRACLVRAMYENFVQLNRIDNSFMTENCTVTNEELCYARSSESQCTIRLLLMLLNRDTHTMLMFIYGMRTRYQDTVKSIFTSLNRHLNDSNFTYQSQCLRCNLSKRVNISLITDHLPQCSNGLLLLPFVNIVSEEDQPGQPTTSERLWNELFKVVNNPRLYQDVIITIARVIESSGYHTDIARMLQDDINLDRNSFVCRCEDIKICQSSLSQSSATDCRADVENNIHQVEESNQAEPSVEDRAESRDIIHTDSKSEKNTREVVKYPDKDNNGASGCAEDIKPIGNNDKAKDNLVNNSRRNSEHNVSYDEKTQEKKVPDLSTFQITARETSLKRSKRKDRPCENETKEKKRRNEPEDFNNSRKSSIGNCDLQIEMLKIGAQEKQPDSGFSIVSLPSTSSYGDSGVYDLSTLFIDAGPDDETVAGPDDETVAGPDDETVAGPDDETVPKQIVSVKDLNSETSNASDDNRGNSAAQRDDVADESANVLSDLSGHDDRELDSFQGE